MLDYASKILSILGFHLSCFRNLQCKLCLILLIMTVLRNYYQIFIELLPVPICIHTNTQTIQELNQVVQYKSQYLRICILKLLDLSFFFFNREFVIDHSGGALQIQS